MADQKPATKKPLMSDGAQIAVSKSAGRLSTSMEELAFKVRKNPILKKEIETFQSQWNSLISKHPELQINEELIESRNTRRLEAKRARG